MSDGEMKGPRKFPMVDWTTVRAELPSDCIVMMIFEDIVVGVAEAKIRPTSRAGSMKFLLVAHALTTPYIVAESTRKHAA
jgi:hypothetical protein